MAVLAPQDWHLPRDHTMDAPSPNNSASRQRSSPANDHSAAPSPVSQQAPYPYPVQQQQAGWTPPHPQQQYYPPFYQNPHQPPYTVHGHPAHSPSAQMHGQNPYYDQANAQFAAQWAYQQMMYTAHQAHQMSHVPSSISSGRSRAGSASTSGDYYAQNQLANYNVFPSGTPPAHPSQLPNGYPAGQGDHASPQTQYGGFHPYRRPNRQNNHSQEPQQSTATDWRSGTQPMGSFQPPYARSDAAGSSTSVNSNSTTGSPRQRTNSTQGSANGAPGSGSQSGHGHGKPSSINGHGRIGSANSSTSQVSNTPPQRPHQRTTSSSSSGSASPRPSVPSSTTASTSHGTATLRRPSPLSQGTFTAAEKRMSRDDSDLAAMLEPAPGVRSGGLKGRLRRALSLNAGAALREEEEDEDARGKSSRHVPSSSIGSQPILAGDDESTATTVQKKKSRSLFNSRLNRSTDNISLSSTMSSASMVIRKLGNIGKLTRRNSLAGITSLFKDKKDKDGEADAKKGKKKKGEKGNISEASVSHVTAELDRSEWSQDLAGLTPAARLARQHTLKSRAEAEARAKAEAEAKAKAIAATSSGQSPLPTTWEKNTTTRQGDGGSSRAVNENGMRVVVEQDDSDSDEDHLGNQSYSGVDGWDDDEDWNEAQDEEDVTIRAALEGTNLDDDVEMEPWAINVRRSVERTRKPAKGILKTRPLESTINEQDVFRNGSLSRHRSNSYDANTTGPELGPLAHIPSPDPDQIDGLHKHPHISSQSSAPSLPPLTFETTSSPGPDSPKDSDSGSIHAPTPAEKQLFSHPNSSAPALTTMFSANPPTLTHRSATAPAKRLAFASNLSVYDTFPATVYDRRSEPATWSRLTPALAQRIKEELNSYKMEEMEVHAASRVHTQFFV